MPCTHLRLIILLILAHQFVTFKLTNEYTFLRYQLFIALGGKIFYHFLFYFLHLAVNAGILKRIILFFLEHFHLIF